jgi:lysozyme
MAKKRKKKHKKRKIHVNIWAVVAIIIALAALVALPYIGDRKAEEKGAKLPSGAYSYGIDISHFQQKVDWDSLMVMSDGTRRTIRSMKHARDVKPVSYVFIKATEGSAFTDDRFAYNFSSARSCHIAVGAYHFFSFDSPGDSQADHFIRTVTPFAGMLPPVIDLEFYGAHTINPPDPIAVRAELDAMLAALESHYGLKPILYATEDSYECYLAGAYEEYDIWIRNVITKPRMSDNRAWTFWQYTNRGRLDGYAGEEPFIDINVFRGTAEEFSRYPRYMQ